MYMYICQVQVDIHTSSLVGNMSEEGSELSLGNVGRASGTEARIGIGSTDEAGVCVETLSSAPAVCYCKNSVKEFLTYDRCNAIATAGTGPFFTTISTVIVSGSTETILAATQFTGTPTILSIRSPHRDQQEV
jgi:hypothetical protein